MTVFGNPSPQVVASWGSPAPGIWRYAELPGYLEPRSGQVYENEFSLSSSPRDPTTKEAYAILSAGVYKWRVEHPEAEVTYLEITRGSPQRLRMQYIAHSPIALTSIAVAFAAVIAFVASLAVPILTIALVVITIWAALRLVDYFIPAPELRYVCPIDGAEFATYAELVEYMRREYPGVPIPSKEDTEKEIRAFGLMGALKLAAIVGVGLFGAYGFFKWVLPAMRVRREEVERKEQLERLKRLKEEIEKGK